MAEDSGIVGPEVQLPGSDQFLLMMGRLLLLLGVLAWVVWLVVQLVRMLRRRAAVRRGDEPPPRRRRRRVPITLGVVTVVGLVTTVATLQPPFFVPEFPPLPQLLPDEALFYRPVTDLPVAADSERWIASQGGLAWGSGFSGEEYAGVAAGMPFNLADRSTPMVDVELTQYPDSSYPGPYPITDPAYIEMLPNYGFDQHYLVLDLEQRRAWELIAARRWFGRWQAGAGASWSMDSVDYPIGSTIAAGLPLLPGTITYDEVADGSIDHLLLGASPITATGRFVWPARGGDGVSTDPDAPPMGAWMRLRADADLSALGPQARVIAEAAQRYGVLLSDTGPGFGLRGTVDARWDNADLATLNELSTDDFEFLDVSSIIVSEDSMAARPPAG